MGMWPRAEPATPCDRWWRSPRTPQQAGSELTDHPLATAVREACAGRFLPADGGWTRVPPWRAGLEAVVAFTGHAMLCVTPDVTDGQLTSLGVDGFGGAHHPRVLTALAGRDGWIDSLDALLVRTVSDGRSVPGDGNIPGKHGSRRENGPVLVQRPDLATHPRAEFARAVRSDTRVFGYPDRRAAIVTLSHGLAGLTELSFALEPGERGCGRAAPLIQAAMALLQPGELVVAAAAPGNAASFRALLAAGFAPVGSMQLVRPARPPV